MTGQRKDRPTTVTETRAEYISRIVATLPPPTPAQVELIRVLLTPIRGGTR